MSLTIFVAKPGKEKDGRGEQPSPITLVNLTAEELRASNPQEIEAVWTNLTSKSGEKYQAIFLFKHWMDGRPDPYIIFESENNNPTDFKITEEIVAKEISGTAEERTGRNFGDGLYDLIRLAEIPTAQQLADFVDKCAEHFDEVSIPYLHLKGMYGYSDKAVVRNAGFPLEKLSTK